MQIYVVNQGDTLTSIANRFQTTTNALTSANQLNAPNQLVVGQALVIPINGQFYFVQSGDSLYSISQRFNINYNQLATINNLSINTPLQVGYRLYIPPQPKTNAEFNGYVAPQGTSVAQNLIDGANEAAPYLTYLAPFSFQVNRDGSLEEPLLQPFIPIAQANNNTLMMVLTNQENGAFSNELGNILLNNMDVQDTFIENIIQTAQKYNFKDIHFDFEYLRPQDREAYINFLRKVKNRFSQYGWLLSVALAPKTSAQQKGAWYEAHDYGAIGSIVDFAVIMTYEWGYSGGPAMAVSPIGPVTEVINYALTEMPSTKIMMGQNLYGYDWTLPFVKGSIARAISPQQAINIARQYGVAILYSQDSQAPYFNYTDSDGKQHEVWFEDARSIQRKFDLVKEKNLRGVSYWKLGLSFPQNWLLLNDNFNVKKN